MEANPEYTRASTGHPPGRDASRCRGDPRSARALPAAHRRSRHLPSGVRRRLRGSADHRHRRPRALRRGRPASIGSARGAMARRGSGTTHRRGARAARERERRARAHPPHTDRPGLLRATGLQREGPRSGFPRRARERGIPLVVPGLGLVHDEKPDSEVTVSGALNIVVCFGIDAG